MSFIKYQEQNPEFLNNFLKYNAYISFCSKASVDELFFDLRTFFRYIKLLNTDEKLLNSINEEDLKEIGIKDITINDMKKVTSFTIDKFIIFLNNNLNNSVKTRNRKLATLKRFFEYLETNNYIPANPARNCRSGRIEKRNPKYLNLEQSKTLLSNTIKSNDKYKIRNYAITCIFLNCCIRVSELTGIDLVDVKLDDKTLKVTGKGNRDRIIYLNEASCEAINEYLKVRPNLSKECVDHNALFLSERYKRLSNRTVQGIITDNLVKTFKDNSDGLHTHSLRHTGASLMYNENDTDILIIKKILGHKSLKSTEIYTHISSKKLRDIMEKCAISSILEKREELKNGK